MADWSQFEDEVTAERPVACQVCEAMLPDVVDGMLTDAEQRAFDRHVAGCVVCARELEEAQRGAAWLGMLKQAPPEPNPALLERILAQTTGAQTTGAAADSAVVTQVASLPAMADVRAAEPAWEVPTQAMPAWATASLPTRPVRTKAWTVAMRETVSAAFSLQWMKPLLQPRMAMTAAMAFFSIALTLNLTGVRLDELNTASLRPSALRRTVADRSAAAVRSFQNMRVVYQAEAQVNDLRSNWQTTEESAPAPQHREDEPKPQDPSSNKEQDNKPQGRSELEIAPVTPQGPGMARKGA